MSVCKPFFPALEPPRQYTQTSYTTADGAGRHSQVSYTMQLAAQHLDMTHMDTLKISRPPSPMHSGFSKERSEKLQTEIEQAVRDRRAAPDHCRLLCVKYSGTKNPHSRRSTHSETAKVGPLVDTEEEWLAWEAARSKPLPRTSANPPLHDRVIEWRSNLQEPSASSLAVSQPLAGPSQSQSQQSTLGFPVVKRSFLVKKNKTTKPIAANSDSLQSKPQDKWQIESQRAASSVPVNDEMRADIMDTRETSHSKSNHDLIPVAAGNDLYSVSPKHSPIGPPSLSQCDFSVAPPPSFPANLPTSTPKDKHQCAIDQPGFTPSLRPDSRRNVATKSDAIPSRSNSDPQPHATAEPSVAVVPLQSQFEDSAHSPKSSVPQPTPPSPPYTSPATPVSRSHQSQFVPPSVSSNTRSESLNQKHARPITPPSESSIHRSPIVSSPSGPLQAPRTPTKRPRREEQDISVPVELTAPQPSTPKTSGFNLHPIRTLMSAPMPPTPDAAINGMSPTKGKAITIDILPFSTSITAPTSGPETVPRTPERVGAALPTTYELLATSRRSAPRPRAPSRKNSVAHMSVDEDVVDRTSPTKSERSFSQFSSPNSSEDESESDDASGPLIYPPSNPPDSPTAGFGFTQDPDKFAPIGESTVLITREPLAKSGSGSGSPRTRLRLLSQSEGPSQTQRSTTGCGVKPRSSGMFSSQFDVDAQVNKLSAFLAHDVDITKWDRTHGEVLVEGTDDEDGDDEAVEALTFAFSPV